MWGYLSMLPAFLAIWAVASIWTVFAIAVANRAVNLTEGIPYISLCGSYPPQSCIFGQLLNIGAVMGNCPSTSPSMLPTPPNQGDASPKLLLPQILELACNPEPQSLPSHHPPPSPGPAGVSCPLPSPPSRLDLHSSLPPAPGLGCRKVAEPADPVVGAPLCPGNLCSGQFSAKEPAGHTPDRGLLCLLRGPSLLLAAAPSVLEEEEPAPARGPLDRATPPGPLQPLHHPHGSHGCPPHLATALCLCCL